MNVNGRKKRRLGGLTRLTIEYREMEKECVRLKGVLMAVHLDYLHRELVGPVVEMVRVAVEASPPPSDVGREEGK